MPKAFDRQQLTITNHPNLRITQELPRTPEFIPATQVLVLWEDFQALLDTLAGIPGATIDDVAAWVDTLFAEYQQIVDAVLEATTIDLSTPQAFVASLVSLMNLETGIDLSSPEALFHSIEEFILAIAADVQAVIDELARLTGLDFSGAQEFIDSLVAQLLAFNQIDLSSPQALYDSIAHLLVALQDVIYEIEKRALLLLDWQKYLNAVTRTAGGTVAQVAAMMQHLTLAGLFDATKLFGLVPNTQVTAPDGSGFAHIGEAMTSSWNTTTQALTGNAVTNAVPQTFADQLAQLAATTMQHATILEQFTQDNAAYNGGLAGGDLFERIDAAGVGANWAPFPASPTTGKYILDGHEAVWQRTGTSAAEVKYLRVGGADVRTTTAFQRVTRVTGTHIMETIPFTGVEPFDALFGRVNAAFTNYLYVHITATRVYLGYNVGAGEKPLADAACTFPTVGSTYSLECGYGSNDTAGMRTYRVLRNGSAVLVYADTGGLTAALDANRGWGWGGRAATAGLTQAAPSSVNAVGIADNQPDPTIGTYLRVYRDGTGSVSKPLGDHELPANTFNQSERISSDLRFTAADGTLEVLRGGPFVLTAHLETNANIFGADRWDLLLYKLNTATGVYELKMRTGEVAGTDGVGTNPSFRALFGTASIYASSGDKFRLGWGNRNSGLTSPPLTIVGDAGGTKTWMTVTRGA